MAHIIEVRHEAHGTVVVCRACGVIGLAAKEYEHTLTTPTGCIAAHRRRCVEGFRG